MVIIIHQETLVQSFKNEILLLIVYYLYSPVISLFLTY